MLSHVLFPFQERLAKIEREKAEEEERMKLEAAAKREEIERKELEAEALRNMPVDHSEIVSEMFGFLPEGPTGDGEGNGTTLFQPPKMETLCIGIYPK